MDILLERILSLIPRKENGDYVHGAIKQFAESIGVKNGNLVSDWIAGRSVSYRRYVYVISAKYNVSVEWLCGETDIKEKAATQEGNGYSDTVREIIDLVSPLTEDQQKWILARLQDSLAALKALDGLR